MRKEKLRMEKRGFLECVYGHMVSICDLALGAAAAS